MWCVKKRKLSKLTRPPINCCVQKKLQFTDICEPTVSTNNLVVFGPYVDNSEAAVSPKHDKVPRGRCRPHTAGVGRHVDLMEGRYVHDEAGPYVALGFKCRYIECAIAFDKDENTATVQGLECVEPGTA